MVSEKKTAARLHFSVDTTSGAWYNGHIKRGLDRMNVTSLIERIQITAAGASDDRVSNKLAHLATRLQAQGALFEKPLTQEELRLIEKFMD